MGRKISFCLLAILFATGCATQKQQKITTADLDKKLINEELQILDGVFTRDVIRELFEKEKEAVRQNMIKQFEEESKKIAEEFSKNTNKVYVEYKYIEVKPRIGLTER